ncbi:MAG: cob(I)yrinic acid a,c-diamide adenosyltransferase [Pirellulaceae bacterium]
MKIYTKGGDRGETGLLGGVRVPKFDNAVSVCGDLDEANCAIGMVLSSSLQPRNQQQLLRIQQDLFEIGSVVACIRSNSTRQVKLPQTRISELEQHIDELDGQLPAMDAFILPGGVRVAASLHLARSIVRRAERNFVSLTQQLESREALATELMYLNRLSDLLFVMARFENLRLGGAETKWLPGTTV